MTSITDLSDEICMQIGSYLDNPAPLSKVSRLCKEALAQGCYEELYSQYRNNPLIKKFMPLDGAMSKVQIVQGTFKNIVSFGKSKLPSQDSLNPTYLESTIQKGFEATYNQYLKSPSICLFMPDFSGKDKVNSVYKTYENIMNYLGMQASKVNPTPQELSPQHLETVLTSVFESYAVFFDAIARELPEAKAYQQQLKGLSLGDKVTHIWTWLYQSPDLLAQIRKLNLKGSHLKFLPAEIGLLTGLEKLILEDNQLMFLPEAIGNLSRLEVLNIARNKIEYLPASLNLLENLAGLSVIDNAPLRVIPTSLKDFIAQLGTLRVDSGVTFEDGSKVVGKTIPMSGGNRFKINSYLF